MVAAWFGVGEPYPGVPLDYQGSYPHNIGQWNIYGDGFVPGETLWLVVDGVTWTSYVLGIVDQSGRFFRGDPNLTSWIGDPTLADVIPPQFTAPFVVTVQGTECEATTIAQPPDLPETCALFAWWGSGSPEPGVPEAYQDPQGDLGYVNLYGSGYLPEVTIYLYKDGVEQGVGDGWASTDSTGAFHVNRPILGGQMSAFQYGETPFTITAKGPLCSASQVYTGPTEFVDPDDRIPPEAIPELGKEFVAAEDPEPPGPFPWLPVGLGVLGAAGLGVIGFMVGKSKSG
ncbi:MAG: hypothetical protein KQH83_02325 [Actinobacteria bacterium]|nr:hypothetical protein [Actinomycetota bacterium]